MTSARFRSVALAVAWRNLHNFFSSPSLFLPGLLFPLFFFAAFAGGLSRIADVPGFDYTPGYTGFQYVFVLFQSAAFSGVFNGFAIARDFESGFARRLLSRRLADWASWPATQSPRSAAGPSLHRL